MHQAAHLQNTVLYVHMTMSNHRKWQQGQNLPWSLRGGMKELKGF